jgi:hypothetical protein
VALGAVACMTGAGWFGLNLPAIRVEAHRLIVAQAVAAGEPPEEMTADLVEE